MAELALGIVSLTFQVFAGCIQGYELLSDAKQMPSDSQYLRVRLKTEQYRLLDWAYVVRLEETDDNLLISNSSKGLLLDVLDQQRRLIHQFGRLDDKYRKLSKPLLVDYEEANDGRLPSPPVYEGPMRLERVDSDLTHRFPQSEALLKKSLEWAKKSTQVPRKLKWASFDKAKMESLVYKLAGFNDFMREMLNTQQLENLAIKQTRTEFQIMQLNSSIANLVQIIESRLQINTQADTFGRRRSRRMTNPVQAYLQMRGLDDIDEDDIPESSVANQNSSSIESLALLAQFKALNSAIQDPSTFNDEFTSSIALRHTASETLNVELDRTHIHILDPQPNTETTTSSSSLRVEAYYQPPNSTKTSIWIEWKTYEPLPFHHDYQSSGGPEAKILERLKALCALLKENNSTTQFRAPNCLGYFLDSNPATAEDNCRFGLVFTKPDSTHPISLHTLLTFSNYPTPSLTARVRLMLRLAETLERLHAVNWLHKGLRSSNILFFSDHGVQGIDYNDPYISGFDYSRPAMKDDMTEKPPENAPEDIYRHPKVQGSGGWDKPVPSAYLNPTAVSSSSSSTATSSSRYKKSYDVYSLGIILLEIAYWKPIDVIVGIEDLEKAKPKETLRVKGRLLDEREGYLEYVRSHLGDRVVEVVRACLMGATGFGLQDDCDEKREDAGAMLGREFYDRVVRSLGEMRV